MNEATFHQLVAAELKRHRRHHQVMPNNQAEAQRHQASMLQYATALLRSWNASTRKANGTTNFDDVRYQRGPDERVRHFVEHEAFELWEVRQAAGRIENDALLPAAIVEFAKKQC